MHLWEYYRREKPLGLVSRVRHQPFAGIRRIYRAWRNLWYNGKRGDFTYKNKQKMWNKFFHAEITFETVGFKNGKT